MKARIDMDGHLQIERVGEFKDQWCIFDKEAWCGDYCPAFLTHVWDNSKQSLTLYCCNSGFSNVEDLRVEKIK